MAEAGYDFRQISNVIDLLFIRGHRKRQLRHSRRRNGMVNHKSLAVERY